MQLSWLETYLDVLDSGNFNVTAEHMGLTQSTVSHRISQLEAALGQKLFTRGRMGAAPSKYGRAFETRARRIMREWNEAIGDGETSAAQDLRLGLQYDIANIMAGDVVTQLREQFPDTPIYAEVDYSTQMAIDLEAGRLDVALLFTPTARADIHHLPWINFTYRMVAPNQVCLSEITKDDYIFPNISPNFAAEHRHRLPHLSNCRLTSGQSIALMQFARDLSGVTYIAEDIAAPHIMNGTLHFVEDAPILQQQSFICCHIAKRTGRMMGRVRRAIRTL